MALTSTTGTVVVDSVTFTIPDSVKGNARGTGIIIYIDYTSVGVVDGGNIELKYFFNESSIDDQFYSQCDTDTGSIVITSYSLPGVVGNYRLKVDMGKNEEALQILFDSYSDSDINIEFKIDQSYN